MREDALSPVKDGHLGRGNARRAGAQQAAGHPPHNPSPPRLAEALDTDHMAKLFEARIFGSGDQRAKIAASRYTVAECEIERVLGKPPHKCSIGYRLVIRDGHSGAEHVHRLCGRIYERGGAPGRFEKAKRQPLAKPAFGPPLFQIVPMDMIVWSFPNDRRLRALPILANAERLRHEVIPELVLTNWGEDWSATGLSHSIANYVHERRCCVRVVVDIEHRSSGERHRWTIYGKTHSDDLGAAVHRTTRQLWDSTGRRSGKFGLARPIAHQVEQGFLWQEELTGTALANHAGSGADPDLYSTVGRSVAALHSTPVTGAREFHIADIVGRLRARAAMIYQAWPARRDEVSAIADTLSTAVPRLDHRTRGLIHGDLHAANIMIDDGRAAFIDLDEAGNGAPLHDVGHFLAYLLWDAALRQEPTAKTQRMIDAFLCGYRRNVRWPVPSQELGWYVAVCLLTEKVFRNVTAMRPGMQEQLANFVALAEALSRGIASTSGLSLESCDISTGQAPRQREEGANG